MTTHPQASLLPDSRLARKLARLDAGLAPEDETIEQAANTAVLRQDPTYTARWAEHEADYDAFIQDLFDYTGRHGL